MKPIVGTVIWASLMLAGPAWSQHSPPEGHVPPEDCPMMKAQREAEAEAAPPSGEAAGHRSGGHAYKYDGAGGKARHGDHATMTHRFDDVQRWVQIFDDPSRAEWQKPAALVAALDIPTGGTVSEIGSGTGYFNPHWAKAVGPEGTVFAMDIEPGLVAHIRQRAETEQTPQVVPIMGSASNPRLPRGASDLIAIVDVYHHIDGRVAYFEALRESVKAGGRLVIVDFKMDESIPVGPPPAHRIPPEQVLSEMKSAGWSLAKRHDLLPYQYVLEFE